MAYSEILAERIDDVLVSKEINYYSKKMMGGLVFMVNDKMCIGVLKDTIMARIDPSFYQQALQMDHVDEMNFTGRAMKGFVFVSNEGLDMDEDLMFWIEKCLEFNPFAKASKKRSKE